MCGWHLLTVGEWKHASLAALLRKIKQMKLCHRSCQQCCESQSAWAAWPQSHISNRWVWRLKRPWWSNKDDHTDEIKQTQTVMSACYQSNLQPVNIWKQMYIGLMLTSANLSRKPGGREPSWRRPAGWQAPPCLAAIHSGGLLQGCQRVCWFRDTPQPCHPAPWWGAVGQKSQKRSNSTKVLLL